MPACGFGIYLLEWVCCFDCSAACFVLLAVVICCFTVLAFCFGV